MTQMRIRLYHQIKDKICNGDLIAWSGKGYNILEKLYSIGIKLVTGPVTHCSTAIRSKIGLNDVLLISETVASGLVFDSLDRRIATAEGDNWTHCWWFPLSRERRKRLNENAMINYLVHKTEKGTPYDIVQGIRSAFDRRERHHNQPDDSSLFCSEEHMFALLHGGAVQDCNPSEAHPTDVIQFDIHADTYYQIWYRDEPLELPNVGITEPDGWDV